VEDVLVAAISQSRRVGHGGQHCGWCFGWGGATVVAEQCTAPKSSGDSGRLRNITAPSVSVNDSTDAHMSLLTGLTESRSINVCQITCNSVEIRKFCGEWKISWLGSKFRGLRKSVVPKHDQTEIPTWPRTEPEVNYHDVISQTLGTYLTTFRNVVVHKMQTEVDQCYSINFAV